MGFLKSIFGIVGGIFKAILGVFGIGKKSEFFMELDESAAAAEAPAQPVAVQPTVTQPAVTQPAAAPPKAPTEVAAQPAVASPAPAPAAPQVAKPAEPVPSFAANYLVGSTMPRRRRPGPSLSPFMDMAKQVKAR